MSKAKNDMSKEAYKEFVCIETANAFDDFRIVEPNKSTDLILHLYIL
jgi:glucose-6-phosphate 1-epimerase